MFVMVESVICFECLMPCQISARDSKARPMSVGGSADRSPLQDGSGNKTAGGSSSLKKTVAGTPAPMTGRTVEGMTIFHEPWWLAAVSGGGGERVQIADRGGRVIRLL